MTEENPLDELAAVVREMRGQGIQLDGDGNVSLCPHGQRPCPICGQHMATEDLSGVPIDVCAAHGIWLDNCELEFILRRVATRRSRATQYAVSQALRDARRDGMRSATTLGIWSTLLHGD